MINTINGNLLDAKGIIVHGVNCQGVMGAGVAKAIREKFPYAHDAYMRMWNNYDRSPNVSRLDLLGCAKLTHPEDGEVVVANLFIQENYGNLPVRYLSYDALDRALKNLVAQVNEINEVAYPIGRVLNFPLIGCGLAGGHWPVVEAIIEHRIPDTFTKNLWVL